MVLNASYGIKDIALCFLSILINEEKRTNAKSIRRVAAARIAAVVHKTKVWANSGYEVGCINSQFPLFALAPEYIHRRFYYWLRGVRSATYFCFVGYAGFADGYYASYSIGVRPFFFVN